MKRIVKFYLSYFFVLVLMSGCATAYKINRLSTGMTKDQVIRRMGYPTSTSAQDRVEYLTYKLSETDEDAWYGRTTPYYVRLYEGIVESFGRIGDFDSTKDPTININTTNRNITDRTETRKLREELEDLRDLYEEGYISEETYNKRREKILDRYR